MCFGKNLGAEVASSAGWWLFTVNEDSRKLNKNRAELLHSITAKLLWVSQRGRPDVSVTTNFPRARVKQPDFKTLKKLKSVLKFLKQTTNDTSHGCGKFLKRQKHSQIFHV